jgi:hypothetical protein
MAYAISAIFLIVSVISIGSSFRIWLIQHVEVHSKYCVDAEKVLYAPLARKRQFFLAVLLIPYRTYHFPPTSPTFPFLLFQFTE